jgi:hypothetical protein
MMARRNSTPGCDKSQPVKRFNGPGGEVMVEALEPVVGVAEILVFP